MATLAEQLLGMAHQTVSSPGPIGALNQGLQQGAELGMKLESMQNQKQQIEMNKEELVLKKKSMGLETIMKGLALKNPRAMRIYFDKIAGPALDQVGMPLDPVNKAMIVDSMTTNPEEAAAILRYTQSIYNNGNPSKEDMEIFARTIGDSGAVADFAAKGFASYNTKEGQQARLAQTVQKQEVAITKDVREDIQGQFKKVNDDKALVTKGNSMIKDVLINLKTGKLKQEQATPILNKVAQMYARIENPGALTDADINMLVGIRGAASLGEEAFGKWVSGEMKKNLPERLDSLSKSLANALDEETERVGVIAEKSLNQPGFDSPEQQEALRVRSGYDQLMAPTIPMSPELKMQILERYEKHKSSSDKTLPERFLTAAARAQGTTVERLKKQLGISDGKSNKRK